jgi:hypothetical protein
MNISVGMKKARALSESPKRFSTVRTTNKARPIGTSAVFRPGKAEVSAATPAVTETATVRM